MSIDPGSRSRVFVSYSRRDSAWLDLLKIHLRPLVRDGLDLWDDTRIQAGTEWKQEIERALASATVAVLLVSPNFLASDFVHNEELPRLLTAAKADGITILCLIIAPCLIEDLPTLAQFQAINPPSNPLMKLAEGDQHQYFVQLARRIKEIFAAEPVREKTEQEGRQAEHAETRQRAEPERRNAEAIQKIEDQPLRLRSSLQGHQDRIGRLAWSPNGRMLASPSDDHTVMLWDMDTQRAAGVLRAAACEVGSVAWSPDGALLATGSADHLVRVWNVRTLACIQTLTGHSALIRDVAWRPNSDMLASASDDGTVRLWDTGTWKPLMVYEQFDRITSLAWRWNSVYLATGSDDSTITLYHFLSVPRAPLYASQAHVLDVAWSSDGSTLASAGADKTVKIWDLSTGELTATLKGHTAGIGGVSFSADGRLLASKSNRDHTVRIWRRGDWSERLRLAEPSDPRSYLWHSAVRFHPQLSQLATLGQGDRVIRIWDVDVDALDAEKVGDGSQFLTFATL